MTVDHYRKLGVARTATHAEIRSAYRQLAQRLHPDTHGGVVSAEMVAVNEAWRVLSDKGRRADYDAKLHSESDPTNATVSSTQWAPWSGGTEDDGFVDDDDTFLGSMAETVAVRRWMVLITFTMIAATLLLTALFIYAFMRSPTTTP
ncbi:MAG TPA: J domain-containing protein [Acidimicrobiales bacterium]|nr:J domain-containing protein [Acidimicrobiales bacterium]